MSEYICPHCKNPIYDDEALLCHFCGESLNRSGNGFLGNMRYGDNKIFWIIGVLLALLSFIFLVIL